MPPRRQLSAEDRGRALAWLDDGISGRAVSRRLGVSHSVVQRLWERFQNTGSTDHRPRSGRPRATGRRDDRFLLLSALRNRTITAQRLRTEFRIATNINVCQQTIRNRLYQFGLHSRRAAVCLPLTPRHRQARLNWCRRHERWTRQQWGRTLFTDESRYTMSHSDGRERVWRRQGERFLDVCIREHDRHGGGSIMVWGGIHLHGRTPLHLVRGTLTGLRYRDEVVGPLIQPALQAMGPGAVLQDDNATAHRARAVTDFMQQHNIQRMDWPARSPDLNPIEHLWDILGRRVRANHPPPANAAVLFQLLQQEWAAIPQATLVSLIQSMRSRCTECVAARGGHTHY